MYQVHGECVYFLNAEAGIVCVWLCVLGLGGGEGFKNAYSATPNLCVNYTYFHGVTEKVAV